MTTHTLCYDDNNKCYQVFNMLPDCSTGKFTQINVIAQIKDSEYPEIKHGSFAAALTLVNYLNGGPGENCKILDEVS